MRHCPALLRLQPPEAGNSLLIVLAHYRELVRPAEAKTLFGIEPKRPKNVMAMPKAA